MKKLNIAIAAAIGLTNQATASERTMYVTGDGLNVRYCAEGDCCIASRLSMNEPVSVMEERDGWARISVYHDATFRNPSCTRPEEGLAAHWVSMTYLSDQVPDGADPNAWFGMLSDRRIRGVPRVGDYGLSRADVETIRRYASRLLLDGTCEGIDAGNKSVVEDSPDYVACEGETEKRYFTARDAAS